jgi:hypothetical protein
MRSEPETVVYGLAVSGKNLFAGSSGGVFRSTNNGTSWTAASTGFANTTVHALAVSGTNLFTAICGSGVLRRPLSQMVTSVEKVTSDLPTLWLVAGATNDDFKHQSEDIKGYTKVKAEKR